MEDEESRSVVVRRSAVPAASAVDRVAEAVVHAVAVAVGVGHHVAEAETGGEPAAVAAANNDAGNPANAGGGGEAPGLLRGRRGEVEGGGDVAGMAEVVKELDKCFLTTLKLEAEEL